MAAVSYTQPALPRVGAWQLGRAPRRAVSRGLPLLAGLINLSPLLMLLVNCFNVAAAGQPYRFGLANWQAALADPSALGALVNSLTLAFTRTAISTPIALGITWLVARTNMPGRSLVELLVWLAIFVPVLPLTLGGGL